MTIETKICPRCNTEVYSSSRMCFKCGLEFDKLYPEQPMGIEEKVQEKICPFCTAPNKTKATVCSYCGRAFPNLQIGPRNVGQGKNEETATNGIKASEVEKVVERNSKNELIASRLEGEALNDKYPHWVRNPNPKAIYSIGFFVLILVILMLFTNFMSVLLIPNIEDINYPSNPIGTYGQFLVKVISGILGALAWKPSKTPWWSYVVLTIAAFIPILCYFPYFLLGKYIAMRVTKPSKNSV